MKYLIRLLLANMNETIREKIWAELNEINKQKENFDPVTLAEKLIVLSTLYGNLTSHIAEKENAYYKILDLSLGRVVQTEKGVQNVPFNRAEISAKAGNEYLELREAQALEKSLIETIRGIKKYIQIKSNEMESSKNI